MWDFWHIFRNCYKFPSCGTKLLIRRRIVLYHKPHLYRLNQSAHSTGFNQVNPQGLSNHSHYSLWAEQLVFDEGSIICVPISYTVDFRCGLLHLVIILLKIPLRLGLCNKALFNLKFELPLFHISYMDNSICQI